MRKPLDLKIHVPVESMREPDAHDVTIPPTGAGPRRRRRPGRARAQHLARDRDLALDLAGHLPRAARLIQEHRSTIVFVNSRRGAERLAVRLNELAAEESDNGDERATTSRAPTTARSPARSGLVVEDLLKSGELPASWRPRRSSSASTWAPWTS